MSIRINFADDSNYAVATMTNIRVNRDNVREPDIMSKIENLVNLNQIQCR